MHLFNISALSVKNISGVIYVASSNGSICRVSIFTGDGVDDIASVRGFPCVLLWGRRDGLLVSAGNTLYFVAGNEARPVLTVSDGNWLWHAAELGGFVFVQEWVIGRVKLLYVKSS